MDPAELSLPSFDTLAVRHDGGVLQVTLNRPEMRNAMSLRMVQELRQVLGLAEGNPTVRVLLMRGAGGHFSAGADLKDMALARMRAEPGDLRPREMDTLHDPVASVSQQFGELCGAYARTPLAFVVLLEGTVMGGGLGLACVADVALAVQGATFRLPETSLGMVPAQIAPFLVERLGFSQAKRLAVTGGRLDAAAALAIGLVHAVHDSAQADAALARVLGDILACAPGAVAATKALIARARHTPPEDMVQDAAAVFARAVQGEEGLEGTTAFFHKRKPTWAP
jgi:isohexenylglutaconyl-CoA hydratase